MNWEWALHYGVDSLLTLISVFKYLASIGCNSGFKPVCWSLIAALIKVY
jgi:hypothetical protein